MYFNETLTHDLIEKLKQTAIYLDIFKEENFNSKLIR